MRKKGITLALALCLCLGLSLFACGRGAEAAAIRPGASVAVLNVGFHGTDNTKTRAMMAQKATEFIGERLFKESKFTVKTLDEYQDQLNAQGIDVDGNIDGDSIEQIGKALGVDYVLYGNIVSFSRHSESSGLAVPLVYVGVETDSTIIDMDIVLKLADTRTGILASSGRGKGNSRQTSGSIGALLKGMGSVGMYQWDQGELSQETVDTALINSADTAVRTMLEKTKMLKKK